MGKGMGHGKTGSILPLLIFKQCLLYTAGAPYVQFRRPRYRVGRESGRHIKVQVKVK